LSVWPAGQAALVFPYVAIALAGFAQAPMLIGMAVLLCQAKEDPRILAPALHLPDSVSVITPDPR